MCDGHEATRRILELVRTEGLPYSPIVALSASCSDEEARAGPSIPIQSFNSIQFFEPHRYADEPPPQVWRCRQSGMEGHIGKPLKLETLKVLETYMD